MGANSSQRSSSIPTSLTGLIGSKSIPFIPQAGTVLELPICKTLHLWVANVSCHVSLHWTSLSIEDCREEMLVLETNGEKSLVSSAKS